MCVLMGVKTNLNSWHDSLGHPSFKILRHIIQSIHLPLSSSVSFDFHCDSCSCNKSHKLTFGTSSLSSHGPLDFVYFDVWGPTLVSLINNFKYYVIFVDHFKKYTWLYPIRVKSNVVKNFVNFKTLVERFFGVTLVTLYYDIGVEYHKLKDFFSSHGIQRLTTPPHTSQHNGSAKRQHQHIVETGLTLLHQAFVPFSYWPFAFQNASYVINQMPTPILDLETPFETLFHLPPNYSKLKTFGCLCYPWLHPYAKHKLQPLSTPCVFLGYSTHQSAYKCLDPTTNLHFPLCLIC